jgi:hypothetical protein
MYRTRINQLTDYSTREGMAQQTLNLNSKVFSTVYVHGLLRYDAGNATFLFNVLCFTFTMKLASHV